MLALLVGALALTGSACDSVQAPSDAQKVGLLEGSADALGVLRFLNHPLTTVEVLDEQVGLDRRAAEGLIATRDGADGWPQTGDDHPFTRLAEVDAVRWVGPATLSRLRHWADAYGWTPMGEDVLGTWEGVTFRAWEALATLALVNYADYAGLDQQCGVERRAVDEIMAARPLPTIEALSELPYVGPATLAKLRAYAVSVAGPQCSDAPLLTLQEARADNFEEGRFTICAPAQWGDCPPMMALHATELVSTVYGEPAWCGWQGEVGCGPFEMAGNRCCYVVDLDTRCE